jgi:hypothetical protein
MLRGLPKDALRLCLYLPGVPSEPLAALAALPALALACSGLDSWEGEPTGCPDGSVEVEAPADSGCW